MSINPDRELEAVRDAALRWETTVNTGRKGEATLWAERALQCFARLDAHLSAGGTPPEEWREGPDAETSGDPWGWQGDPRVDLDDDDPRHRDTARSAPEGLAVFAHWSASHTGINVEIDLPDGLPLTVHVNDGLMVNLSGTDAPADRLEYLRGELRAERISQGELLELQSLAPHIDPGDVELLEAAGVPEFPEDDEPPGTWGPTPAQEEGWDAREDYARGGQDAPDWTI